MTPFEEFHVNRMLREGCRVCGRPAEWNHWMHGLNGIRISKTHLFGIPLCPDHHRTGKDAVHKMGSEDKFCQKFMLSKERSIEEVAESLRIWVSGQPRKGMI